MSNNVIPSDSLERYVDINFAVTDTIEVSDSLSFFGSDYITGPEVIDYTFISIINYLKKIGLATTVYFNNLQTGPLIGTGTTSDAQQGFSSSISADGNTCITGGIFHADSGAVWIFTRTGIQWSQQGSKIIPVDIISTSTFGSSVDISADGNTAVIGAPFLNSGNTGATYIYIRTNGIWTLQDKLIGTGGTGTQAQGTSVALSADGNTVAIGGSTSDNTAGAVWIFTRTGLIWTQQGLKLVGTDSGGSTGQGFSVDLSDDGNTLVEGSRNINGSSIGGFWVFTRSAGVWTQKNGPIIGSDATIYSTSLSLQYVNVSISGDGNNIALGWTAIGFVGAVWVFTRLVNEWTQQIGPIVPIDINGYATIGKSTSLSYDGNILLFGGQNDNFNIGALWIYSRSSAIWTQLSKISNSNIVSLLGASSVISSDGTTLVAGGTSYKSSMGAIWIYTV